MQIDEVIGPIVDEIRTKQGLSILDIYVLSDRVATPVTLRKLLRSQAPWRISYLDGVARALGMELVDLIRHAQTVAAEKSAA